MENEITRETIVKMGADARLESANFTKDVFCTLLKKYREIRDSSTFLEESTSKLLQEQIEQTIETIATRESQIKLLEVISTILKLKD